MNLYLTENLIPPKEVLAYVVEEKELFYLMQFVKRSQRNCRHSHKFFLKIILLIC